MIGISIMEAPIIGQMELCADAAITPMTTLPDDRRK